MNETANKHDDNGIGGYLYRTIRIKIAELLRQERLARGLSYDELGQHSMLRSQYLRNVEYGEKKANWVTVGVLLKYYHKRIMLSLEDMNADGQSLVMLRNEQPKRKE